MFKKLMAFLAIITVSGCSSSGVSWDTLDQEGVNADYCSTNLVTTEEVQACEAEYAALERARVECQNDSRPAYCMLMAEHGWKRFKEMLNITAPTKEHAKMYPVLCGFEENKVKACSNYK